MQCALAVEMQLFITTGAYLLRGVWRCAAQTHYVETGLRKMMNVENERGKTAEEVSVVDQKVAKHQ